MCYRFLGAVHSYTHVHVPTHSHIHIQIVAKIPSLGIVNNMYRSSSALSDSLKYCSVIVHAKAVVLSVKFQTPLVGHMSDILHIRY